MLYTNPPLDLSDEALESFVLEVESLTSRFSYKELRRKENYVAIRTAAFEVGKTDGNTSRKHVDKIVSALIKEARRLY